MLTFQPTGDDLAVMGLNAMDPGKRVDVTRRMRDSARARLERADAQDRIALLAAPASGVATPLHAATTSGPRTREVIRETNRASGSPPG